MQRVFYGKKTPFSLDFERIFFQIVRFFYDEFQKVAKNMEGLWEFFFTYITKLK